MLSPEGLDKGTCFWFQTQFRPRTPWLEPVLRHATALGDQLFLLTVSAAALVFLLVRHRYRSAAFASLAFLGGLALMDGLKLFVGRERPDVLERIPPGYSFPSGHALMSMTVYVTLALVAGANARSRGLRGALVAGGVALALVIGFSRLYLCVHYLTDVVAGWAFGLAWTLTCHWLSLRRAPAAEPEAQGERRAHAPRSPDSQRDETSS